MVVDSGGGSSRDTGDDNSTRIEYRIIDGGGGDAGIDGGVMGHVW